LLTTGSIIDERFELVRKIGSGSFGQVFEARQLGLDRIVALKILRLEHVENDARDRMLREANLLASIKHRNIVTVFGYGTWHDAPYLAMEFLHGQSLADRQRSKHIPMPELLDIFLQICDALAHAHAHSIIHRDLKPDNVFVTEDNDQLVVKVIDFGLAKLSRVAAGNATAQQLTEMGLVVGTVSHMSPEQCRGIEADNRSDIYSLGCTLYQSITGETPFSGDSALAIMLRHATENAPRLADTAANRHPALPALQRVIDKCMAKEPTDRYASVSHVAQDLATVKESLKTMDTCESSLYQPKISDGSTDSTNKTPGQHGLSADPPVMRGQRKLKLVALFIALAIAIAAFSIMLSDYCIAGTAASFFALYRSLPLAWQVNKDEIGDWCLLHSARSTDTRARLQLLNSVWHCDITKSPPNCRRLSRLAEQLTAIYRDLGKMDYATDVCNQTFMTTLRALRSSDDVESLTSLARMSENAKDGVKARHCWDHLAMVYKKRNDPKNSTIAYKEMFRCASKLLYDKRTYIAHLECAGEYTKLNNPKSGLLALGEIVNASSLLLRAKSSSAFDIEALHGSFDVMFPLLDGLKNDQRTALLDQEASILEQLLKREERSHKRFLLAHCQLFCYLKLEKSAEAINCLQQMQNEFWSSDMVHSWLPGTACEMTWTSIANYHDPDALARIYNSEITSPDRRRRINAYRAQQMLYTTFRDYRRALQATNRMLEECSSTSDTEFEAIRPRALMVQGECYAQTHKPQEAITALTAACPLLTSPPEQARCLILLGCSYSQLQNPDEAVRAFDRALQLSSDTNVAYPKLFFDRYSQSIVKSSLPTKQKMVLAQQLRLLYATVPLKRRIFDLKNMQYGGKYCHL
jgi:serine/threonine protein kinase/tetratricopeptide (TPR) repeat protein